MPSLSCRTARTRRSRLSTVGLLFRLIRPPTRNNKPVEVSVVGRCATVATPRPCGEAMEGVFVSLTAIGRSSSARKSDESSHFQARKRIGL